MWKEIIFVSRFGLKIIEEGMVVSFGILLPALTKHLGSSSATTGFLISLHISLWYLAAPLAQLLLDHCGRPRILTTVCGFLAALFVIGTLFTKNVAIFSLLLISSALCASVLHRQAPLLLHQYFPTNFTFISISTFFGTSIGGLLLPQLVSLGLMAYGVSGALLIIGGIFLNLLPIGLALKVSNNTAIPGAVEAEDTFPLISKPTGPVEGATDSNDDKDIISQESSDRSERGSEKTELCDYMQSFGVNMTDNVHEDGCSGLLGNCGHVSDSSPIRLYNDSHDGVKGDEEKHDNGVEYKDKSKKEGKEKQTNGFSRFKEIVRFDFWIKNPLVSCTLIPSFGLISVVVGGWDLFEVTYGISQGLEPRAANLIPMASITGSAVSHMLFIVLLRYRPNDCVSIFFLSCCLSTLGYFLTTLHSSLWFLLIMSFVIGMGMNGVIATSEGVIDFVVDKEYFADGSTINDLFTGLGLLVSGFVAGYIRDISGSMKTVYRSLGALNLLACLLMLVLVCKVACTSYKKNDSTAY